ncbi:sterol desaturase family protein [Ilyomonas limi]|uniref:Sterol desaturase family protein n=1 Tax=Ilyomonas limi TaxID=2575867 RepID=A0A4U3L5N3_9BACT|nr:sterol desaturase family protein [Ilyomonas limi]TKK70252.1 sterol desaturase family protein [Ilyomonas limi]
MEKLRAIFDSIGTPVLMVVFATLFIIEGRRQLRKRVQSRWHRIFINFVVSLPAFTLLRLLLIPAMVWLAVQNEGWHFGLNYLYNLPAWAEAAIAFILLDYTNYCWHILNHKIPLLWRFHLVHHTDADLDVTTAIRFHFGEIIGSVFFRGAAVVVLGATPLLVLIYEIVFEACTQFHHSNMKLPLKVEKALNILMVTPRMHGIHHSVVRSETDSNYSVIFSFWDRIHRTMNLHIPQQQVVIGVPMYSNHQELTIGFLLKLPFTKIRAWKLNVPEENSGKEEIRY